MAAEKAARGQVEHACAQLGVQLLDRQRQLQASQTREADAITRLAEALEKVGFQRYLLLGRETVSSCSCVKLVSIEYAILLQNTGALPGPEPHVAEKVRCNAFYGWPLEVQTHYSLC